MVSVVFCSLKKTFSSFPKLEISHAKQDSELQTPYTNVCVVDLIVMLILGD